MEITQPQVETVETQPQVETAAQVTTQAEIPQSIKVKYNHQEMELPYDDAIKNIQKGMNYDKVYEELNSLKNDETLKWIDSVAKEYGVSRQELKDKWANEIIENKANELAEAKEIPPEIAKELLKAQQERDTFKQQFQAFEQEKKQKEIIDNQIKEFREAYPDVKDDDVPDEVITNAQNKGIPLKIAYEAYLASSLKERVKTLEEQLKVKSVNDANASSSMGSVDSAGNTQPVELSEEVIKNMTSKERQAKMPKIIEWLNKQKK